MSASSGLNVSVAAVVVRQAQQLQVEVAAAEVVEVHLVGLVLAQMPCLLH